MTEPELVTGIFGIDSDEINKLVADARIAVAAGCKVLAKLAENGFENRLIVPGLHPYIKFIFGDTFILHSTIIPSSVADLPSTAPPKL